jgi:photolyase PhrII
MTNDLRSSLPHSLRERCRAVNDLPVPTDREFGLYWMATAVRADENPALSAAACLANDLGIPLLVYHGLSERYPYASDRIHTFILQGARDVQQQMQARNIAYAFHLERPVNRNRVLRELANRAAFVVTEEMPVEPVLGWRTRLAAANLAPVMAVDTACLLPMQLVPQAYTRAFQFRKATEAQRSSRLHDRIVDVSPEKSLSLDSLPFEPIDLQSNDLSSLIASCDVDHAVGPVPHTVGGTTAGNARWNEFLQQRIRSYHKHRNDALSDGVSRMSPYLHFGMVAPQRLAREAAEVGGDGADKFLDELLIWRELAYNFCFHRDDHEQLTAIPEWARETLRLHDSDNRPSIMSWETLARGRSGDALWDAAQQSLLQQGELHNNVRMTWGKQFLSWTANAESALRLMVDLNHRYALDGRDPSSYGGLLWCLGQFDRPFTPEQPIIGTVRPRPTHEHARRLDTESYRTQVTRSYADPMPRVAIVGAGISGMMCARTLVDHGYHVEVFEKSRGLGGRMATRRADTRQFDHGAQYFTVRDERFARYVASWQQDGVVAQWEGRVAVLGKSESIEFSEGIDRYVATPSMNTLAKHLGQEVTIRLQTRIGKLIRKNHRWQLRGEQHEHENWGEFDFVVLAIPAGQAAQLLPTDSPLQRRAAACSMSHCWAAMFAFPQQLHDSYEAAFVHNSPISWLARNASKPMRSSDQETWVVHAAPDWSRAHDGEPKEQMAERLLQQFGTVLGIPDLEPTYATAHFWRYAIPTAPLADSCLFDDETNLAACGDWCAGPRVEGAFLSGAAVAGQIMGHYNNDWSAALAAERLPT